MNRLLPSFITTSVFVLSCAFAGTAAADPFSLTANCALPSYIPDKCGLTVRLADTTSSSTATVLKLTFKVNGKEAFLSQNDTKNPAASFTNFSSVNNLPVTCNKSYKITAVIAVVVDSKQVIKSAGTPVTIKCPANVPL
ncbi:exported hypothetical protein [Crenothrix polyspora]|uniref:Lipoprotein n=1 Tax=Crenothrix polyspora TaxID=360316 RepID=A0A1R4GYX1_9GAMM|nr:hypothetical protein [Crenothrix polyspora]SJM89187.1 exported hypothetical protein [Crenothrix polyspora]